MAPENQDTSLRPDPAPHPLLVTGTDALRALVEFYDEAQAETAHVTLQWQLRARNAEQDRANFANQLHDLLRLLPLDRKPDETVAAAVLRHVGQLSEAVTFQAGQGEASLKSMRSAFVALCQKHNIKEPCHIFTATILPLGFGTPPFANCDTCGHPSIAHDNVSPEAPAATEAAS